MISSGGPARQQYFRNAWAKSRLILQRTYIRHNLILHVQDWPYNWPHKPPASCSTSQQQSYARGLRRWEKLCLSNVLKILHLNEEVDHVLPPLAMRDRATRSFQLP